jgi:DNA replication protein DnaC
MESMKESLRDQLRRLRLSGLSETLDLRLSEAQSARLTYAEFLELILQDELLVRDHRTIMRRVKNAAFRDQKTLEDFDWGFNPRIQRSQMYELATGKFIKQRRDLLICSPPRNWQESPCAGHRVPADQARLYGVVSVDLRRGP